MSETQGTPADPVTQFRNWMMSQSSMGPAMRHTQQEPQPYQRQRTDRSSAQGYGKRAALHDFASSVQNVIGQVSQKIQQRKAMEQQHVFDRFTQSVQGIRQSQQQLQEAQAALKENPQDPQALQRMQQAQQALKQNQSILDSMFNGPHGEKNAKILSKGFGIDDKNADTPERQQAMQAIRKSYGVGQGAAGIISQLPMTQQQNPNAMKPPTGGQMLNAMEQQQKRQQEQAIKQLQLGAQQGISDDKLKMIGTLHGIEVSRDTNGQMTTHVMSKDERAKVPYLKAQDDFEDAKTEAMRAMTDAKNNPNSPEMRVKMMDAQSRAIDAQARMLTAKAAQMRAMASGSKEPPEVSEARKSVTKLTEDISKTQLAMGAKNASFFHSQKYDQGQAQKALDTLQAELKQKQSVLDAYGKGKQAAATDDDILKSINELDQ